MAEDPHGLSRFIEAQAGSWEGALAELEAGRKRGHWMWFVFPQIAGLGGSSMAQRYAIRSLDETRAYLDHPVLGPRLVAACEALLKNRNDSAEAILGGIDALKLRSSMTLFATAAADPAPFEAVLAAFYDGRPDERTLALLDA